MQKKDRFEARKQSIREAAQKVFSEKGFHEATISEVAQKAGISEATIYEYFSSKEELLFSIPGETERRSMEMLAFILDHVRGASNKIRSIIYHYLWLYQNHLEYAAVVMLILKQNRKFLDTIAYQAVRERSRVILRVVEEGISSGEFRPETNPYLVRAMILGTVEHLVVSKLLVGRTQDLRDYIDQFADQILVGIRSPDLRTVWRPQTESGHRECTTMPGEWPLEPDIAEDGNTENDNGE